MCVPPKSINKQIPKAVNKRENETEWKRKDHQTNEHMRDLTVEEEKLGHISVTWTKTTEQIEEE